MNALVATLYPASGESDHIEFAISCLPLSGPSRVTGHLPVSLAPVPRFTTKRPPALTRNTTFGDFVQLMQIYCDDGSSE